MRKLFFSLWYLLKRPPWDTGIAPPILVDLVEQRTTAPGRALDLGCGTGTNAIYLAQRGWEVVGVDFAAPAIRAARRKARQTSPEVAARVDFKVGDVSRLDWLAPPFDLVFDQGCFHSLTPKQRAAYAAEVARLMRGNGLYLLWAFEPGAAPSPGISEAEVRAMFNPGFDVVKIEPATSGRPAAWYTLQRK